MCRSSYSLRLAKLHITWSDLISRMIKDSHHMKQFFKLFIFKTDFICHYIIYLYLAHFEVIGMCRSSYSLRLAKLHITWSDYLISRMIKDSHHSVSILIRKVILSISHQYVITSIFSRKPLCILIYIKIYSTSHFDVKLRCKEDVHLYRSFIRADGSIIRNSFLWSDHIVNFIPRINQLGG